MSSFSTKSVLNSQFSYKRHDFILFFQKMHKEVNFAWKTQTREECQETMQIENEIEEPRFILSKKRKSFSNFN